MENKIIEEFTQGSVFNFIKKYLTFIVAGATLLLIRSIPFFSIDSRDFPGLAGWLIQPVIWLAISLALKGLGTWLISWFLFECLWAYILITFNNPYDFGAIIIIISAIIAGMIGALLRAICSRFETKASME
jgi:hypothetical protein